MGDDNNTAISEIEESKHKLNLTIIDIYFRLRDNEFKSYTPLVVAEKVKLKGYEN